MRPTPLFPVVHAADEARYFQLMALGPPDDEPEPGVFPADSGHADAGTDRRPPLLPHGDRLARREGSAAGDAAA